MCQSRGMILRGPGVSCGLGNFDFGGKEGHGTLKLGKHMHVFSWRPGNGR